MTNTRHNIDGEADRTERPHVRLCHLILREALVHGFAVVELATPEGAMPTARAQLGGEWKPMMAFPVPVYPALVGHFKTMAGVDPAKGEVEGVLHVQVGNRQASIALTARRAGGADEVLLHFPSGNVTQAAV